MDIGASGWAATEQMGLFILMSCLILITVNKDNNYNVKITEIDHLFKK